MAQVFQSNVFQNDVFQVAAGPAAYVLDTTVGTYSLTGSSANTSRSSVLTTNSGSYSITGATATTYPRAKINATSLTSGGSQTAGTSFSSASISPTADKLILVTVYSNCVTSGNNSAPTSVNIAGSLSFTQVAGQVVETNWGHISVWRATSSSPPTGTVNFTFPNSRDTVVWSVTELNAEITGTNAANGVVQSAGTGPTTSTTTLTNTLASAYECAGNGAFSVVGAAYATVQNPTFSPEGGWTEVQDQEQDQGGSWTIALHTAFRDNYNDTSSTHTSSVTSSSLGGIILELRGKEISTSTAYTLDTTVGTYSLTGSSATTLKDSLLTNTVGSYAVTGSSANVSRSLSLSVTSGSYTLTGFSADLTYTAAGTAYVLDTVVGSYAIDGISASLEYQQLQQPSGGTNNVYNLRERIRRDDEEVMKLVMEAFRKIAA